MITTMLKFRLFKVAFSADVEKMYRQIQIHDDQTNFQRILWRDNPNVPIQDYKLKTITYGTANAPYLAIRTLKQLALDVAQTHPIASQLILNNMYVDDLVAGSISEESAIQSYHELKDAFNQAGMNLRKWCTTSDKLRSVIPEQDLELKACDANIKALGISWSSQTDNFTFDFKIRNKNIALTKRSLLSEIASLYDPLGWISPVVIRAKNLMQLLWKEQIGWDESPPSTIIDQWNKVQSEIHMLNQLVIPRWVSYSPNDNFELHGFCDASELAYAAVIYLKNVTKNIICLLIAKTRVALLKHTKNELTIPRLELCGATLLAKLTKFVVRFKNNNRLDKW